MTLKVIKDFEHFKVGDKIDVELPPKIVEILIEKKLVEKDVPKSNKNRNRKRTNKPK